MGLNDVQFKMVIDAVVWGIKHPLRAVADVALKTMQDLLINVTTSGMGPQFFQKFYIELLQHMFAVATDTTHYAGLLGLCYWLAFHLIALCRTKLDFEHSSHSLLHGRVRTDGSAHPGPDRAQRCEPGVNYPHPSHLIPSHRLHRPMSSSTQPRSSWRPFRTSTSLLRRYVVSRCLIRALGRKCRS